MGTAATAGNSDTGGAARRGAARRGAGTGSVWVAEVDWNWIDEKARAVSKERHGHSSSSHRQTARTCRLDVCIDMCAGMGAGM